MTHLSTRLEELGIVLPEAVPVKGRYRRVVVHGDTAYVTGATPVLTNPLRVGYVGEVGTDLTLDEAREGARTTLLGIIASLAEELGDVDRIERFLHIGGYVRTAPGFWRVSQVLTGASGLIAELFGDDGLTARTAVGVAELPHGTSIMIDAIVAIRA